MFSLEMTRMVLGRAFSEIGSGMINGECQSVRCLAAIANLISSINVYIWNLSSRAGVTTLSYYLTMGRCYMFEGERYN